MKTCAIIGYGGMGEWHENHIRANMTDCLTLKGVWDIRPQRLEHAKSKGVGVYGSLEEVLNDQEVELVTIATPNDFHKPLSIACLKAGKNVVCEKPVMMNAAELQEVLAVAEKCGKVFTVHQNRRWDKDFVTVKEVLNQNTIGKPYYIESRVQGSRRVLNGWRGVKAEGGGMLLDWGIHLLDQIMWMIDSPVVEVGAHLFALMPGVEVDDNIKLFLRFENGISALIEVATNCFILQPRWHVSCEEGTLQIDGWDAKGKIIRLADENEMAWDEVITYTEAGPTRTMAPRPRETVEEVALPQLQPHLEEYYQNICHAIDGKADLIVKPAQALRVMQVVDAAFEAAEKGCSVACRI